MMVLPFLPVANADVYSCTVTLAFMSKSCTVMSSAGSISLMTFFTDLMVVAACSSFSFMSGPDGSLAMMVSGEGGFPKLYLHLPFRLHLAEQLCF